VASDLGHEASAIEPAEFRHRVAALLRKTAGEMG